MMNEYVEDEKFKNRPISLKEEILIRCEDDRYELNVLLDCLKSCIVKMDTILKLITTMSEHDKIISVQHHLSILQFKCIEKL